MQIVSRIEHGNDMVIVLENDKGQYIYTQRNDNADEWAVFQEMPRQCPEHEKVIFTVNSYLEETGDRTI